MIDKDKKATRIYRQLMRCFSSLHLRIRETNGSGDWRYFWADLPPDFCSLCAGYASDDEKIILTSFINHFFDYELEDMFDLSGGVIDVARLLPEIVTGHMDTVHVEFDQEQASLNCTTVIYITRVNIDIPYLHRVLDEIIRCKKICLGIIENYRDIGSNRAAIEREVAEIATSLLAESKARGFIPE